MIEKKASLYFLLFALLLGLALPVGAGSHKLKPLAPKKDKIMNDGARSERVTYLPVYVTPYYSGPKVSGGAPVEVAVGTQYDSKLRSTDKADILAVRDMVTKESGFVSPMTLYVLSARLFDVGEKEEAVFWFYVARDRYRVTQGVGDPGALATALDACGAFNSLMGPFINGFAFCNVDKQIEALKSAARWTANNPYQALLSPNLASPHKDRAKAMADVAKSRMKEALESEAYLKDPKNRKEMLEGRKKNGLDKKFCF